MLKNQKGITLVALVVTIVVLIILAAISISIALDDKNIVKRAQEAEAWQANADARFNEIDQNVSTYINEHITNALAD